MANKATPARAPLTTPEGVEWEHLPGGGLGDEWNFERDGTLIANFLGVQTVATEKVESGTATALQFAPINEPESIVFVWQSAELMQFTASEGNEPLVRVGDLVKITFLGRDNFTGPKGPQQIKRYRVDAAKRG